MDLPRRVVAEIDSLARDAVSELTRRSPRKVVRRAMSRAAPARRPGMARLQMRYRNWRLRQFLSPVVTAGDRVFDIGANKGEWTSVMRELGAAVVAVEPQEQCVEQLRQRFRTDSEVQVVDSAVGRTAGTDVLHLAATSSEHASMSDDWRRAAVEHQRIPEDAWVDAVEVPVTTLDSLIAEFGIPGFCKIDVEGLEAEVLAGLSRALPALSFEFHKEMLQVVERCVEHLSELGRFRFRIFVDEWPDPVGGELAADHLVGAVSQLPPYSWGMILAQQAGPDPGSKAP